MGLRGRGQKLLPDLVVHLDGAVHHCCCCCAHLSIVDVTLKLTRELVCKQCKMPVMCSYAAVRYLHDCQLVHVTVSNMDEMICEGGSCC